MSTDAITVIGAGPYGLSVAAHLRSRGLRPRVFGDVMGTWRDHMPVGMMLKSMPCASNLAAPGPGSGFSDYCAEHAVAAMTDDDVIPLEMFNHYGRWFAQRHVPEIEPIRVEHVEMAGRDFDVTLGTGETYRTAAVVVATGLTHFASVPRVFASLRGHDATALVSHTWDHPDLSVFAGRRVAIIGGGQSALNSAALMQEAGCDPCILVRSPRVIWGSDPDTPGSLLDRVRPWSPLGDGFSLRFAHDYPDVIRRLPARGRLAIVRSVLGPSGAWWLRDRVEGKIEIRLESEVVRATAHGGGVRLLVAEHGGPLQRVDVDHVLVATGYHVDIDRLPYFDPELRDAICTVAGSPTLNAAFEASVPNVYFTGLAAAATFGPMLRFVEGSRFAARRISAAIGARRAVAA
jgi:cation diffusion facilitator CzcD-associated flavoprotein CzcO